MDLLKGAVKFLFVLLALLLVPRAGRCQCPGNPVSVAPTGNLQKLVTACPSGTTFNLLAGLHHDSVTSLKNGDTFTGQAGAIENGAKVLTGWSQVTINSIAYWTTTGGTPVPTTYDSTSCTPGYPGCYLPQDLYLDSTTYTHVTSLANVTAGTWYYEYQGLTAATVAAGGSGYAVGDVLGVAGGTGGTVSVATLNGTAVASVTINAVGSGYPATPTTEGTTGGTGTGCTVTVTGGSGGLTNNIYLASSENPNSHTVELGLLEFAFQSNTAQNITIQGLTVEKYANDIDHGTISTGYIGCSGCTASGWIIQNNEIRLTRMAGVAASAESGANQMQILNNLFHHNGQYGVSGGRNSTGITESGNTIYFNNVDNVDPGYGAGGQKLGHTVNNVIVSYNISHDNNGHGLWSDVDSQNVTFDHNTVYNNNGPGIHIEVSNHQTVTNNILYGNLDDQIQVVCSSNVTVQNNVVTAVSGGYAGIRVSYSNARDGYHPDFTFPTNMHITNNRITFAPGQMGSKVLDNSQPSTAANWEVPGMLDSNTYCVSSLPWTEASWAWGPGNPAISWTLWQSDGQDPNGSPTLSPCSGSPTQQVIISGPVFISGSVILK